MYCEDSGTLQKIRHRLGGIAIELFQLLYNGCSSLAISPLCELEVAAARSADITKSETMTVVIDNLDSRFQFCNRAFF